MNYQIEKLLQDKNNYVALSGTNIRLFWQYAIGGTVVVTDQNKHITSAGWQVITWERAKLITLYFGDSLEEALEVFQKNNS